MSLQGNLSTGKLGIATSLEPHGIEVQFQLVSFTGDKLNFHALAHFPALSIKMRCR
jgi:hypothetical protein